MFLKYIFLIVIIGGCLNVVSGQNIKSDELLQKVVKSVPTLSFTSSEISKRVKIKYRKKFNTTLNLSDPGSPYNKTDVVYKDEPFGMLLFSGTDTNNMGFLLFEVKGITSQCYFIYYELERKNVRHMESIILKKQPRDFEDLKKAIINKEYF